MISREKIYETILADQNVTDAVIAASASYVKDKPEASIPAYFRVCAALSEAITGLDLINHGPESVAGTIMVYTPYVVMGMPGFADGVVATWSEAYLNPKSEEDYMETLRAAMEEGDSGKANYLHGLMVTDTIADILKGVAGTSLMVAAAVNMGDDLLDEGFTSTFGEMPDLKVH